MIPGVFKRATRKALGLVGVEVHRKGFASSVVAPSHAGSSRSSVYGVLRQVKDLGFSPATVIDVGGAFGLFASEAYSVFRNARYMLVEPLEEYKPHLEAFVRDHPTQAEYILAAAAAQSGQMTINVHPDLVGSSLYLEEEVSNVNGIPRTVTSTTLDHLVDQAKLEPPFLLKIDVQGAELDVLAGFEKYLQETEFVLLEVSFFKFFLQGPQFYDVLTYMKARGFVAYDICGLQYRPLDNALSQVDMIFVKESGQFRQHHYYATSEQREEQFRAAPASL
ncbi:MAG: FkbM family methyltransferase [Acidobacteriota bacterium]|nr:FkbM family methyltransferase [Acidobacteriota bacterium]